MYLLIFLLIASIVGWLVVGKRALSGRPLLSLEPRRHVPWGLLDLGILILLSMLAAGAAFGVMVAMGALTVEEAQNPETPPAMIRILLGNSIATLLTGGVTGLVVLLKNTADLRDLGFEVRRAVHDLLIGVFAFLLIGGPVYLIQYLLAQQWKSTHPIIELVLANPSMEFFVAAGFSAVIVAPIVEEFVFRVLIQGWCEKLASFRGDPTVLLLGRLRLHEQADIAGAAAETTQDVGASDPTVPQDDNKPHASPVEEETTEEDPTIHEEATITTQHMPSEDQPCVAVWPIFASATMFALMHYSHGPDPIPLFFFALGLGYLYRQTHRILPCIVVHFLLNALSLGMLIVQAYYGTP